MSADEISEVSVNLICRISLFRTTREEEQLILSVVWQRLLD